MEILRKYGVATHIYIPIIKRAVVDFAVSADWTPVAGDVQISKDGGAAANVTNLPTAITMGNTAMWDFSITATEMQAAQIVVMVADAATKAVEDQSFLLATYGNASARHAVDLNDSVRAGLTALPNAAAEAAGGLYTRGSGAGQINQQANGQIDVNVERVRNAVINALISGRIDANTQAIANAVIAAATFAAGAIDAAAIANGAIDAATFAAGAIDNAAIATDAIGAAELAASAVDEIVNAVWDELTTEGRVASSYGQLFKDDINATISSRMATFTLPTNFASLVIDANGRVDLSKWLGVAVNALIAGRVDANAQVVGDKSGYSLTQGFPTNFSSLAIDVNGRVDLSKVLGAAINALISGRVDAIASVLGVDSIDATALATSAGQEIADRLLARSIAGGADGGRSVSSTFRRIRNRVKILAGTLTAYQEDDTTPDHTAAITTTAGDPVSEVDPA